jgi:[ribosomal protein S5]-alanine N-acetyltransferase
VVDFETARLRIRDLTLDDAAFILELVNEPAFLANIGDKGLQTLDDARRYLREGPWTRQKRPGYGQFRVELKHDCEPIGICGLLYRDALDVTDVGFAVLERHRGRGYATEAAVAVMSYGRLELGISEIVGLTSPSNLASIRVLEKLCMKLDGIVRMSEDDPGTALYR